MGTGQQPEGSVSVLEGVQLSVQVAFEFAWGRSQIE